MMDKVELILTQHAKERMAARGISKEQILLAVERGAKQKQTDGLLASYAYIEVAYKIIGTKYIIKTVKIK